MVDPVWMSMAPMIAQTGMSTVMPGRVTYCGTPDLFGEYAETVGVFDVNNACVTMSLAAKMLLLGELYPGVEVNVRDDLWHVTQLGVDIGMLLSEGLRVSHGGVTLFGKGIYLGETLAKANAYQDKSLQGNAAAVRMVLRCGALYADALCEEFAPGQYDVTLRRAPGGKLCVRGQLQAGSEYVYYDVRDVCVKQVVFYRLRDVSAEQTLQRVRGVPVTAPLLSAGMALAVGAATTGQGACHCMITKSLGDWFEQLATQSTAMGRDATHVRRLISQWLRRLDSTGVFVANLTTYFKRSPGVNLVAHLDAELAKCVLPGLTAATSIGPAPVSPPPFDVQRSNACVTASMPAPSPTPEDERGVKRGFEEE